MVFHALWSGTETTNKSTHSGILKIKIYTHYASSHGFLIKPYVFTLYVLLAQNNAKREIVKIWILLIVIL